MYHAVICASGRNSRLGAFETAKEAARAYDAAARKAGKPANRLNFPNDNDAHNAAATQQSRKRMRTVAGADVAAAMAKRAQLAARLAALERALSDAKAAGAGSAARASALQAELAASQAHVTELSCVTAS
jgi:hypothetical protein